MESKESCVFCNTEQSVKNMRRHITLYCDKARAECPGGDLLQEWERRTAKRKGFGDMLLFVGGGKHMIPSILEQILMLWHNIRHSAKEIKHFDEIWPSYLTFEIL